MPCSWNSYKLLRRSGVACRMEVAGYENGTQQVVVRILVRLIAEALWNSTERRHKP